MDHVAQSCAHCQADAKSKRREFSASAWQALVFWGEIEKTAVDRPICPDCYSEFREILVERSNEVDMALAG